MADCEGEFLSDERLSNGVPHPKSTKMKNDTINESAPQIRQLPRHRHLRLVRVWRDEFRCGWGAVNGRGNDVLTFDHILRDRENNLLQIAVCHIMKARPNWIRRFGIPKNLSLRNLARLELTE